MGMPEPTRLEHAADVMVRETSDHPDKDRQMRGGGGEHRR